MNFNLIFSIIPFGIFVLHFIGWRRNRAQFAGNELILLPLVFTLMVMIPGTFQICTVRVAGFSSFVALHVLFSSVRKKSKEVHIPVFVCAAVVMSVYELVFFVFELRGAGMLRGYMIMNLCLWGLSCVWLYLYAVRSDSLKNTVSVRKVLVHIFVFAIFTVLSGTAFLGSALWPESVVLQYVCVCFMCAANMWYVHYDKPDYLATRNSEWGFGPKRGEYTIEKRYGQIIEDEGGNIADESIVEDSRIIYSLMNLFEREKLYLNVDVKIANVALMIGTNKTYLSRALNTRLSKNFCQFVNYYRIREVCSMFIDNPEMEIRGLAEQCGFNSSSNFSIVFKYNTGFTPGDWCRIVKQKLDNNEPVFVEDYIL